MTGRTGSGPVRLRAGSDQCHRRRHIAHRLQRLRRRVVVFRLAVTIGSSVSVISELLPDPLTPVTQTRQSSGNSTVMFFRLLSRALRIVSRRDEASRPTRDDPTVGNVPRR